MEFHRPHEEFLKLRSNSTLMLMVSSLSPPSTRELAKARYHHCTNTLPSDELERMVSEAERFAKENKEKRDAIDPKNQADSVVYQTKKQLKDLGDKVPAPVKEKVEAKLGELKDAISGSSTQSMKDAMTALNQEVMQLGQSLYNQTSAGPGAAGPTPGAEAGPSETSDKGPDGDVINADFADSK